MATSGGSIRVVNRGRFGTQAMADELVIDVDGTNAVLGNSHLLADPSDEDERARAIAAYADDLGADMTARGPMYAAVRTIANLVAGGHKVALRCWCAPLACHGDVIAGKVAELSGCEPSKAAWPPLSLDRLFRTPH